jgi:hypothetical protein
MANPNDYRNVINSAQKREIVKRLRERYGKKYESHGRHGEGILVDDSRGPIMAVGTNYVRINYADTTRKNFDELVRICNSIITGPNPSN